MATEEQLTAGLKAAAAAGNTDDARAFAQALQAVRAQNRPVASPASSTPVKEAPLSWSDVPGKAVANFVPSAVKTVEAVATPFLHPIDTAKTIYHTAAGYAEKALGGGQDEKYADALNKYVVDRYGSPEAIKNTIATDPVGAATDLATFIGGGATMAAKAPGIIGKTAEAIGDVAKAVNPVNAAAKGVSAVARPVIDATARLVRPLGEAPSIGELKTAARASYDQALKTGVAVKGSAFNDMVQGAVDDLATKGIDPTLHPRATAVINRLKSVAASTMPQRDPSTGKMVKATAQTVSLQDLDTLRKVASSAANSTDASERMMGSTIIDHLDDFVDGLDPKKVTGPNSQAAIDALNNARALWAKASKGDVIQNAMERAKNNSATYNAAGYENALRVQFRSIANNAKAMRRFTPQEQKAIQLVARGGKVENLLRQFGRFSPTSPVHATIGGTLGFAAGGPYGAVAVPAAAAVAKRAASALTTRNAQLASELVRGAPVSYGVDWTNIPGPTLLAPYTAPAYQLGQVRNQQQPLMIGFAPQQ